MQMVEARTTFCGCLEKIARHRYDCRETKADWNETIFIPLHDGKPVRYIHLQWVTLTIIGINLVSFVMFNLLSVGEAGAGNFAILAFGHIPSVSNDLRSLPDVYQIVPDSLYVLTTLTSAFLHADIWHLGGNMLFIWVFGDNVEDALGHIKYLIFYMACAFAAAWFHAFVFSDSDAPLV